MYKGQNQYNSTLIPGLYEKDGKFGTAAALKSGNTQNIKEDITQYYDNKISQFVQHQEEKGKGINFELIGSLMKAQEEYLEAAVKLLDIKETKKYDIQALKKKIFQKNQSSSSD